MWFLGLFSGALLHVVLNLVPVFGLRLVRAYARGWVVVGVWGWRSVEIRGRLLRECGVAVVAGAAFGWAGVGTLGVSFASGGVTLARGLEGLRAGLEAL
jgi:aspartate/methionine/tyrosine aminotransferase